MTNMHITRLRLAYFEHRLEFSPYWEELLIYLEEIQKWESGKGLQEIMGLAFQRFNHFDYRFQKTISIKANKQLEMLMENRKKVFDALTDLPNLLEKAGYSQNEIDWVMYSLSKYIKVNIETVE